MAARKVPYVRTRKEGQPKRGPLRWEPSDEERAKVKLCMGIGYTVEETALLLGKSADSLQRYCRAELDAGKLEIDAKIGAKLIDKCMKGDTASLIFWHKTRRGWREKNHLDITSGDRPLTLRDFYGNSPGDEQPDA